MKFAFSARCTSGSDWTKIAAQARALGYQGVEIDLASAVGNLPTQGIPIACVSCVIDGMGSRGAQNRALAVIRQALQRAQSLDCQLVKVAGIDENEVPKLGRWLQPLGDSAVDAGATLVIENQPPFATSHPMWLLMEAANHPAIAAAWNVSTAATCGESPWVSIPNLNSRIAYTMVPDTQFEAGGATDPDQPSEPPLKAFLQRLMGVGYQGWVTVECRGDETVSSPSVLADALRKLQEWTKPPEVKKPALRPAPVSR